MAENEDTFFGLADPSTFVTNILFTISDLKITHPSVIGINFVSEDGVDNGVTLHPCKFSGVSDEKKKSVARVYIYDTIKIISDAKSETPSKYVVTVIVDETMEAAEVLAEAASASVLMSDYIQSNSIITDGVIWRDLKTKRYGDVDAERITDYRLKTIVDGVKVNTFDTPGAESYLD